MAMSEFTHDNPESLAPSTFNLSTLTIETALYVALGFVALFLRLFILDTAPLNADEAQQAIASWQFINGNSIATTGSPLLFTGNAILFTLFGATDFTARLVPALFGSMLVLLPALLRRELGRSGALIASALLALSPSLVLFSRTADGAIIAVTCAFAAVAFAWRAFDDESPRALNLAAVFAALALVAARETWTIVGAILFFALTTRVWNQSNLEMRHWRFAGALFAIVLVGVATTGLTHREGLGATFELINTWLAGLRPSIALFDPLRLLIVYEPIAFFFGVAAVIQLSFTASANDRSHIPLAALSLWIGIAFVLYSLGEDKHPARVVVLTVPLALVAGWFLGNWLECAIDATDRSGFFAQELPVYLLPLTIAAFFYLTLAELSTRGNLLATEILASTLQLANAGGLLVVLFLTIAVAAVAFLIVATVGIHRAKDVAMAIVLTILAAWTFRQSMMLNFAGSLDPREYLVARAGAANVRDLVRDIENVSRWRVNDSHTLTISADASNPIIVWYLRNFRNAQFTTRPVVAADTHAILLPANAPAPASGWISQRYRIETIDRPTPLPNVLRWLLFRDIGDVESIGVALWIPAPQE